MLANGIPYRVLQDLAQTLLHAGDVGITDTAPLGRQGLGGLLEQ